MVHGNAAISGQQRMSQLMMLRSQKEEELKVQLMILDQNNIGMNEPLIDSDDYPRSDIDVFKVRHARQRVICLRNDLKNLMADIEKQLYIIHRQNRQNGSIADVDVQANLDQMKPFIRVNVVTEGSPADIAGLKSEDLIVKFGSLNFNNFEGLKDVSTIVINSVNQDISVVVIRHNKRQQLLLKPQRWSGDGFLGCTLLPFS